MSDPNELSPEIRFHLIRRMERLKVIGLGGTELLPHERKYLEFHRVSGIILFRRNVRSLSQVGELVGSAIDALREDGVPAPLVMADHEGDLVAELRDIIGAPPAALAIAATGDVDLAEDVAFETGRAMLKLGVNAVLAPVADCYFEPESAITGLRTFGSDPERVGEFVARTIAGFRRAGVLACAKHFPGHGSTAEDSHETLPEVRKSMQELRETDLVPFRRAVEADVDMMMTSHVAFPDDSGELVPASFDTRLIRGMLREEMGYGGVVITDALEMAGARWYAQSRYGGFSGGFEHALLAGSDLLLHARPVPEQVQMQGESEPVMSINVMETIIKTLERVVDRARIDTRLEEAAGDNEALANILAMLDSASERVNAMRVSLGQGPEEPQRKRSSNVIEFNALPTVPNVYREVAERAVVALGDPAEFEPWPETQRGVVIPIEWTVSGTLHAPDLDPFLDVLMRNFPRWRRAATVRDFVTDEDGSARPVVESSAPGGVVDAARWTGSEPGGVLELAADEQPILVLAARGTPPEEFLAGLQAFAVSLPEATVLVTGWPVFDWVPDPSRTLWTIGCSAQVASAVGGVLAGHAEPGALVPGLLPRSR